jgi:pimeloyl-ACP methyl ester carboxylesterase
MGEATAAAEGVHLITFDQPGYGRSPSVRFGLLSIARAALEVADALGVERFWTMGQSGGGPFALATAFVAGDRVAAAGSASGRLLSCSSRGARGTCGRPTRRECGYCRPILTRPPRRWPVGSTSLTRSETRRP